MDSELVESQLSNNEVTCEGDERWNRSFPFCYEKVFYEQFPYYLSIGMTAEQYWDEDSTLTIYYRKAEEIRKERSNYELWLQGMYMYDALARVSPLFRSFGKQGTKAMSYVDKPYPINERMVAEAKAEQEKKEFLKAQASMEQMMVQWNMRFAERSDADGNND